MTEPVEWHPDGRPFSARFQEGYHSEAGAVAQARHVFLGGCGLPGAWATAPEWRILETGFGLGLNFLTSWQVWRDDPARPGLLHFVSVEAYPVSAADLLRAAAAQGPALAALGAELAAQWHGLLPGCHRLVFDGGRVMLTLCVGDVQPMLRALQPFEADSIFLDGFSPQKNPQMWTPEVLKALARFARPGTGIATWTIARAVRDALAPLGFVVEKAPGLPPKRDCLRGRWAPAWQPRRPPPDPQRAAAPGECVVVGAGLAGAAVAASLARRGWRVTVLDAAEAPATGASGAPAAVLAPHVSPDDALLSRLTRAGARLGWRQVQSLLADGAGTDWQCEGVLERRPNTAALRLPPGWQAGGPNDSWTADAAQCARAALPPDTPALWHAQAGWVRPAALVAAWLATPGVRFVGNTQVAQVASTSDGRWQALDDEGAVLAEAERLVLAGGHGTRSLVAGALPLQPVRGQLVHGPMPPDSEHAGLPAVPLNGDGHLVPGAPLPAGPRWLSGSTFSPGDETRELRTEDTGFNLDRLERLHSGVAALARQQAARGELQAWAGVRCASADRRPLVGPVPGAAPGLWVSTAMGSRGLSFAALCAELLAARWHGEPLPVAAKLARGLDTSRVSV